MRYKATLTPQAEPCIRVRPLADLVGYNTQLPKGLDTCAAACRTHSQYGVHDAASSCSGHAETGLCVVRSPEAQHDENAHCDKRKLEGQTPRWWSLTAGGLQDQLNGTIGGIVLSEIGKSPPTNVEDLHLTAPSCRALVTTRLSPSPAVVFCWQ